MAQPLQRSIVHLDADAFFASVEQSADARLRGKPIAVGGEKRGVIASASYEARKFGIYTPMPTALARRLCPKLILLPGDFEKYELFSRLMFSYAYDFTPDVEIGSIDEGYFDLTGVRKSPLEVAQTIREAIRQSLKLPVSEGIAANKLVSQIASKLKKPSAFEFVPPGTEAEFLEPLANKWLPGVGPKTATQLNAAGLALIGQVAQTPPELLGLLVGTMARQLSQFARGVDERPVVPVRVPAKSYGEQETFAADTTDEEFLDATLRRMADKLMAKVRADEKSIRTVTVKVRYNDMAEQQTSESLAEPTDLETDIYSTVSGLLRKAWQRRVSLRLVALRLSNVYQGCFRGVLALDSSLTHHAACERLAGVVDQVRQKFGRHALLRGHDFVLRSKRDQGEEPSADQNAATSAPSQLQETPIPYEAKVIKRQRLGNSVALAAPDAKGRQIVVSPGVELKFRFALPPLEPVSTPASAKPPLAGPPPSGTTVTPTRVNRPAANKKLAIPLNVHSYYSFLDSTLSIRAVIELAQKYELHALALTDRHNLHGAVEFAQAAVMAGIQPITGAELLFKGQRLCLYAQTDRGYHRLCRILSQPAPIGPELFADTEGLLAVGHTPELAPLFPGRFYLAVDTEEFEGASPLPRAALFPVHYATPGDRWKYDVVQSIRTLTLLRQSHPDKRLDGEFHFRTPSELSRLFAAHPEVLRNTQEIADRCSFILKPAKPQFPSYTPPDGSPPAAFLRKLAMEGLVLRYPKDHVRLRPQLEEELAIITEVGYEEYFLVMWDILQECRRRDIQWITRGSAADSLACYCLGISGVCPIRFDLYFRRFLNKERMSMNKLPDIDVDFPHDRKDDVIDLIFEKYGPEHTAVVGGFSTFQARSAFAEVAKVLGVSDFQVRRITERLPYFCRAGELAEAATGALECRDLPLNQEPYATAMEMAGFLDRFPRYAKMHPCGLVLSRQSVMEITPCFTSAKGYPTTHFDMDSVEAVGLIKMDILAQGGLAVMRDVQGILSKRNIQLDPTQPTPVPGSLPNCEWGFLQPWNDPEVWELIASGGARAVHHIESPAMISLCRMCNVHDIDTLIAIVSVIRPGAANESKKMEFARRYQGLSHVHYPHPMLEGCLRSTYGLVVYEEHILQICEAFASLPPSRADVLRRALGKDKEKLIEQIRHEFTACARRVGRSETEIAEVWNLVVGFKGYAFCKAHSTAYGVEAYQSAWLKRYYPAEFMAGVLSNGKGFYSPLVYVLECHRLGIPLLPPWINSPGPEFSVEDGKIRVPALRVKGLSTRTSDRICADHNRGEFASLDEFWTRVQPLPEEMEWLIRAGAFDLFGKPRTAQYWEFRSLTHRDGYELQQARSTRVALPRQLWLLPQRAERLPSVSLAEPNRLQKLQWEDELLGFTVSGHPLELHPDIAWETYCPVNQLDHFIGCEVVTCGLIVEQRIFHQVTGEPMKFITIADRTGIAETELFAKTYRSFGLNTVRYRVLEVTAVVEPFESGRGWTLRVLRAGKPRMRANQGQ